MGSKCFIIARVQTWDHKKPDKAYYSYYNAYHINKILFRTQMYMGKKLIHRLHVLNPLTNTDIIGHVQYFMVRRKTKADEKQQHQHILSSSAAVALSTSNPMSGVGFLSQSPNHSGDELSKKIDHSQFKPIMESYKLSGDEEDGQSHLYQSSPPSAPSQKKKSHIRNISHNSIKSIKNMFGMNSGNNIYNNGSRSGLNENNGRPSTITNGAPVNMTSPSVREVDDGVHHNWTLASPAVCLEDEDDRPQTPGFLRKFSFFSNSKDNLNSSRRGGSASQQQLTPEVVIMRLEAVPSSSARSSIVPMTVELNSSLEFEPHARDDHSNNNNSGTEHLRQSVLSIASKQTRAPVAVGGAPQRQAIPAGAVTRFAVPVHTSAVAVGSQTPTQYPSGGGAGLAEAASDSFHTEPIVAKPRTPPGHRRNLSLANSDFSINAINIGNISGGGGGIRSSGGGDMNGANVIEEWKEKLKTESAASSTMTEGAIVKGHNHHHHRNVSRSKIVLNEILEDIANTAVMNAMASPTTSLARHVRQASRPKTGLVLEEQNEVGETSDISVKSSNNYHDPRSSKKISGKKPPSKAREASILAGEDGDVFWDATLFATDEDFLESSKIRLVFKHNALSPDDVQLFKFPEFATPAAVLEIRNGGTGVVLDDMAQVGTDVGGSIRAAAVNGGSAGNGSTAAGSRSRNGGVRAPQVVIKWSIWDSCFPSRSTLRQASKPVRLFHKFKCYILALIIMFIAFFFIYHTLQQNNKVSTNSSTSANESLSSFNTTTTMKPSATSTTYSSATVSQLVTKTNTLFSSTTTTSQ